ncbi:MAG: hypothetical protein AAGG75_21080 [Bacteroidota bacterium]
MENNKTIKALRELYIDIHAKEKIEIHLKNIDRLILEKEAEEKRTAVLLLKEERDVKQLEAETLVNIFRSVLGNREQALEKERQEYLQAFLVNKAARDSLEELKKERTLLLKVYSSKFRVEDQFDKILSDRHKEIARTWPELGEDILHFESSIANHKAKIREIQQAKREGQKTIRMLQQIAVNLDKVESWGGLFSKKSTTNRRRSKDKIQRAIKSADTYLQRFEKELFDLSDHYGLDYSTQINEIKGFINQIFDSLISDWIIKEAIVHSANVISNQSDKITRIVAMLDQHILQTKDYIKQEQQDKRKLVARVINKK